MLHEERFFNLICNSKYGLICNIFSNTLGYTTKAKLDNAVKKISLLQKMTFEKPWEMEKLISVFFYEVNFREMYLSFFSLIFSSTSNFYEVSDTTTLWGMRRIFFFPFWHFFGTFYLIVAFFDDSWYHLWQLIHLLLNSIWASCMSISNCSLKVWKSLILKF